MVTQNRFAPGARVEIRDCEWIVRRADPTDDGGYLLTVDGLSEPVNGKTAEFLTDLEDNGLRLLAPAETKLELDDSPGFEKSRLFIETQLRPITAAGATDHIDIRGGSDMKGGSPCYFALGEQIWFWKLD